MANQETNKHEHKRSWGLLPKLILAIAAGIAIGLITKSMNFEVPVRIAATFNSIFGNFLNFVIPLIIVGFIVPGIADLGAGAGKSLAITAGIAYASTIVAGSFAYGVDSLLFPNFLEKGSIIMDNAQNAEETMLSGYFTVEMPPLMGVMTALIFAFIMGLGIAVIRHEGLKSIFDGFADIVSRLISAIIIPLLPFHIFGIFANMAYAGTVAQIMKVFAVVFLIIIVMHWIMLLIQYSIAGSSAKINPISALKNMIPAYMTAIGTQSSAATIPVTLQCTKNNDVTPQIADFVIPLCATIHLAGSTITLTSCAMAVMMLNGWDVTFGHMFPFILMLGVTMVAAPGVPGGAVMAALGVLQSMLGFNENMLTLMIALYIAQDSFGTACNVTGDGAIAILVDSITGHKPHLQAKAEANK
ncbi:dicarboxylate/amino acid:cation symporter [Kallipyga gabonensis]|uniref:dicarboxylate/amino acid:cation symporter n=1 Tax=Kallipyga gabonensis TaxID=1686287 RepID=UPI0006B475A3|nr:dicarboxylate/amino acid:cation symporter [Kallipyga gabonensis]